MLAALGWILTVTTNMHGPASVTTTNIDHSTRRWHECQQAWQPIYAAPAQLTGTKATLPFH
jgi:hypothetical protein